MNVELTKKGTPRKRKPKTSRNYFTKDTENAIIEYLLLENQFDRDMLYNNRIKDAFFKLTQNIIHTYKMYYTDGENIEDLQQEVIVFLLQQLHKYKPEKGAAYSYFGTIAKRYLILKNTTNYQKLQDKCQLEEVDEDQKITSDLINESNKSDLDIFLNSYTKYIEDNLNKIFTKELDLKIADSILELFRKRYNIEIFNKKALYIYIREMIDVKTPQITKVVKILKKEYIKLFNKYYEDGDIYSYD